MIDIGRFPIATLMKCRVSSILLKDIISELPPCVAITPDSPKTNSLIMEDEHLDTIPETKSDKLIKSSVKNLVQILSESEDSSEGECDLPPDDDSSKNHDLTFYNPLFDIIEDFTSSDESFCEVVDQIDDEVLENTNSIPPGIDDVNLDSKGDILFLESLLYDNSYPRPPEEFNSENPTESFSPSPIPVEDNDSLIEEIDIFLDGDDSIPPGIESDDFDSEDDDILLSRRVRSFQVMIPIGRFNH
ncbi:hypothetical protein Tco_1516152 [Tanacetum coccineum]